MDAPHLSRTPALSRRHVLRGLGTTLTLPFLDAMVPAFASAQATEAATAPPQRFVAVCAGLGFHGPNLFPEAPGRLAEGSSPYLEKLKAHHDRISLFSGLCHPNQQGNNGHASSMTWLTSAQRPGLAGFRNSISLDQLIAREIGMETRFPFLALANSGSSLSWTGNGVEIPAQSSPSKLFASLFVPSKPEEIMAEQRGYQRGRSILDTVRGEARKLEGELGPRDREKLDEYLTSVRELEIRLQQNEDWAARPKPKVDAEMPRDIEDRNDVVNRQRLLYDVVALALQTDSTRTVTLALGGLNSPPSNIPGVDTDWHGLSHHGKDEEKIEELQRIEEAEFGVFNDFLTRMRGIDEGEGSLLDRTSILFGSNLGNASSHDWHNLPILVAGGGFKHGSYHAHDAEENTPFANLFVTLAQRMGVETDRFGSSTGAGIAGLEG